MADKSSMTMMNCSPLGYGTMSECVESRRTNLGEPSLNYTSFDSSLAKGNTLSWESLNRSDRVTLSWRSLNVFVKPRRRACCRSAETPPKQIINNICGTVEPGQLVALMGSSGAGKTTLLNVLTMRNCQALEITGDVMVNGKKIGDKILSLSAYIQQDDLFIGTMTVREHLTFQALLRLPKKMPRKEKLARVNKTIDLLGLNDCANTIIGIPGQTKGISGGESKRLSFASEVLTDPPLLFCDEPTTGLDSFMAESVVKVLNRLASKGKTILCTIHQPPSAVYSMFNYVYFLAEGRVAYSGPTMDAIPFFSSIGYSCPTDYNPADYFMHVLALDPANETESAEKIKLICNQFATSTYGNRFQDLAEQRCNDEANLTLEEVTALKFKATWWEQFRVLNWRCTLNSIRNRKIVFVKYLQKIIFAIFLGLLYFGTALDQAGIMSINGALFYLLAEFSFSVAYVVLNLLPAEYPVLIREHHSGLYKVSSYYLSKVLSMVPVYSTDALIFLAISYFMVGLRNSVTAFFICVGTLILIEQASFAFGSMLSAASPNFAVAASLAGPVLTLIQLTGGLYTNVGTLPVYISWFQYLSWFRYGFETVTVNQWHGITNITCEIPEIACIKNGDEVLKNFNFTALNVGLDYILMAVLIVAFHLIAYLCLWWRTAKAR